MTGLVSSLQGRLNWTSNCVQLSGKYIYFVWGQLMDVPLNLIDNCFLRIKNIPCSCWRNPKYLYLRNTQLTPVYLKAKIRSRRSRRRKLNFKTGFEITTKLIQLELWSATSVNKLEHPQFWIFRKVYEASGQRPLFIQSPSFRSQVNWSSNHFNC